MITPLHVHSGFSLARGPVELERLVAAAAETGHAHLAVTDVNGLYGATRFHHLAERHGMTPIIGAELRLAGLRAVALVESDAGYANLCRLITGIKKESATEVTEGLGRLEKGHHKGHKELKIHDLCDLRVLCGCSSDLAFIATNVSSAARLLAAGVDPERLYVGIDPGVQARPVLHRLLQFADEHSLPAVATATTMMLDPADRETARVLAAIRLGTTVDNVSDAALPPAGAILRSPATLAQQYRNFPGAVVANQQLVECCSSFRLLPREPVFPAFPCNAGEAPARRLRSLCQAGLPRRYGPTPSRDVLDRLDRELKLIEQLGFSEYFLVVHDIVGYARRRNAPVAGRGSGASSIVAYLLGVTNVCPIACRIPFERFLHEQREDFPDLDIDFCWRIRDDVIDYAFRRWGRSPDDPADAPPSRAAMVCTQQFFKPRSALREAAKAVGLSNEQITRIAGHPQAAVRHADDATRHQLRRVLDFADRITGLPHAIGMHPGGIVLAPGRLDAIAPLEASAKGPRLTQYDKHGVEDIGLVKIDLLGNRNLSTVRQAIELIPSRADAGLPQDSADFIASIPHDDPATIAVLRSADTIGCNQLESPAMRHLLAAMQPSSMLDVMKTLALIRPGAASIGMKETFVRRQRGEEPVPPLPPAVADALADSHGVMLYEDDVMTTIAAMTGLPLPQADRYRRAIQKCFDDETRRELSRRFLRLCGEHGCDPDFAGEMWVQMAKFNAYSFCRAHAGSYAQLAYAGAWLKTHWPLAFWTAALNNNQSMYHPRLYVDEARRAGIRPAGVDVNRSAAEFSIDGERDRDAGFQPASGEGILPSSSHSNAARMAPYGDKMSASHDCVLRAGLNCVDGLGEVAVGRILDARKAGGAFIGVGDFLARTRLSEPETRALILCGAFDSLGRNRPTLIMQLQMLTRCRQSAPSLLTPADPTVDPLPPDYDEHRKWRNEWRITGLSIRQPFIAHYRHALQPQVDADSRSLHSRVGQQVRIAGVLEARRVARTMGGDPGIAPMGMNRGDHRDYGGKPMMFVTLADEWGVFEVTIFPNLYRRLGHRVDGYGPYIVTGTVEQQHNVLSITAADLRLFDPRTTPVRGGAPALPCSQETT